MSGMDVIRTLDRAAHAFAQAAGVAIAIPPQTQMPEEVVKQEAIEPKERPFDPLLAARVEQAARDDMNRLLRSYL